MVHGNVRPSFKNFFLLPGKIKKSFKKYVFCRIIITLTAVLNSSNTNWKPIKTILGEERNPNIFAFLLLVFWLFLFTSFFFTSKLPLLLDRQFECLQFLGLGRRLERLLLLDIDQPLRRLLLLDMDPPSRPGIS